MLCSHHRFRIDPMSDAKTLLSRRSVLALGAAGVVRLAVAHKLHGQEKSAGQSKGAPTKFHIACMTLPYSQYPLARALSGIKSAGFEYVALYTSHKEPGETKAVPVMPPEGPLSRAKE